jgi:Tol biopolymer transport system component
MGEVYKARDTRLRRTVAIKLLTGFDAQPDGSSRLLREAQAASALNHPNIVTVHDVVHQEECDVIVMEYIEGTTLGSRIGRKGLPVRDALNYAIQIAGALSAAHAAGIVHRDVKPGNVVVGESGAVKVLDFGLAKVDSTLGPNDQTASMTSEGMIVGTFLYMSPEQVEGRKVDARSDIFAFGSLLYEMLSGRPAFAADSRLAIVSAILHRDPPPLRSLRPDVPPDLEKLVQRCLRKGPARRMQSMEDVRLLLEEIPDSPATSPPVAQSDRAWLKPLWFVAGFALAAGVLAALLRLEPAGPDLSSYRLVPFATEASEEDSPAWSPDGRTLAYQLEVEGIQQIYTRSLDAPSGTRVTSSANDCLLPFWSPDGNRIYYVSRGQLWSVSPAGGVPRALVADAVTAAVSPDGKTMVVTRGEIGNAQLFMPSAGGGYRPYRLPPFPDKLHMIGVPQFASDGSKIAVGLSRRGFDSELWIVPFPSGAPRQVPIRLAGAQNRVQRASWMPDSRHLILAVEGHLSSIDTETGALRRITAGGAVERQPAVSPDGHRIAFAAGSHDFDIVQFTFGKALPRTLLATARTERGPVWSPQQSQYAYITDASGVQEIWLRNAQEEGARPLVQPDPASPWYQLQNVRFSPDGRRISYDMFRERHAVAISNVAGGRPVMPDEQSPDQHGLSWSPDGNWIAYRRINGAKWELVRRPLGGGEPVWLEDTAEGGGETDWSLSGEWICHRVGAALHLVSADGKRHVEVRTPGVTAFGFSRDSATLYALRRNSSRKWELAAFAVPGGREKRIERLDLPVSASVAGFSVNRDGGGFITSVGESRFDLWLLEGFSPSRRWFFR